MERYGNPPRWTRSVPRTGGALDACRTIPAGMGVVKPIPGNRFRRRRGGQQQGAEDSRAHAEARRARRNREREWIGDRVDWWLFVNCISPQPYFAPP